MGTKKLPRGISLGKSNTVYISFQYLGSQCREPKAGFTTSDSDLNYLKRLKGEIDRKIKDHTFVYADYFPESPRLLKFGSMGSKSTVGDFLTERLRLDDELRELSRSTLRGYAICIKRLTPLFNIPMSRLDTSHISQYVSNLRSAKRNGADSGGTLKKKTLKETLNVLNKAIKLAMTQKVISRNPLDDFNLNDYVSIRRSRSERDEVDPFGPEEVNAVLENMRPLTLKNYYQLRFFSGLTVSEANALKWRDVDFVNKKLRVRAAYVMGELKETKNEVRDRLIDLEPQVVEALTSQKELTFLGGEFIFLNPRDDKPFNYDQAPRLSFWEPALKRAGVRYRPPKQTRHTYACMMISQGRNLWWLKAQMGHGSLKMLEQHYGSFMKAFEDVFSNSTATADYSNVLTLYRTRS